MTSLIFGNGTDTVRWHPSPTTRGTFDLLSTCIITMLLCVWTAVHLNVPPPGQTWSPGLRKCGWLVLALLAPEMVAFTAWYQKQQALRVSNLINDIYGLRVNPPWYMETRPSIAAFFTRWTQHLGRRRRVLRQPTLEAQKNESTPEGSQPSTRRRRHPWTLSHGFYAAMGGFAMDLSKNLPQSKEFLPSNTDTLRFVTPIALEILGHISPNEVPDLSVAELRSKSKADVLAKVFTCIQATWFIAQCLTRLAQHIPISLLELNTFGHAICALLIYVLWWDKPFEVDYPTVIEGPTLQRLRALTWMLDNESIGIVSAWNATHTKIFRLSSQPSQETAITEKKVRILGELLGARKYSSASEPDGDDLFPPKFRKFLLQSVDPTQLSPEASEEYNRMWLMVHDLEVLPTDITRWKMALNFAEIIAEKIDKSKYSVLREALVRRCGDWPQTQGAFQDIRIVAGFTTAALVYGGLHALAWFIHFPSRTEQLLWRIAVCVVMAGLPVTAIFISIWRSSQIPRSVLEMIVQRNRRLHVWLMLVFFMMGALYAVARAYLVVECFINVAHLPPGVYQVPNWAAYFSHVA